MAAAAHAQEKPKAKERRLTNKNIKRVNEELDNVDELLQDVLDIHYSVTNGYALTGKRFLLRPRASDSAIVHEYVTHACTCVDKRHDVVQGWRSLVFDKSRLNAPSPYALLVSRICRYECHKQQYSKPISRFKFTQARWKVAGELQLHCLSRLNPQFIHASAHSPTCLHR